MIGRDELPRNLATDPVPLGLIGILGLGSLAAMLFAGIGFLVSSTVSTSERIGEFALLRALGLSTGQLSLWLSIESIFLLVVGLLAGSLLGLAPGLARPAVRDADPDRRWPRSPRRSSSFRGRRSLPIYVAAVVLFVVSRLAGPAPAPRRPDQRRPAGRES